MVGGWWIALALLQVLGCRVVAEVLLPEVLKEAEFAVRELQQLSDSGIYSSITLERILSSQKIEGRFYDNLALQLELRSPHFKSKAPTERFTMVVMKHKTDNVTTLAMDEFPVMDEEAIEQFYIQRVEERRRDREHAFDQLYREALDLKDEDVKERVEIDTSGQAAAAASTIHDQERADSAIQTSAKETLEGMSLQELHDLLLHRDTTADARRLIRQIIRQQHGQ